LSRAGLPARDERDEPSRETSPASSEGTLSRSVSHDARALDASRPERRARRLEKNANRTRASARDCRSHDDDGRARRDDGRGAGPRRRRRGHGRRRAPRRFRRGGDHPRGVSQGCRHRRRMSEALHARGHRRDVPVARGGGRVARRGRVPRQSLVEHPGGLPRDVLRRCEPGFSASRHPRARPSVEGRGARAAAFSFFPAKEIAFCRVTAPRTVGPARLLAPTRRPARVPPRASTIRRAHDASSGNPYLAPSRYPLARAPARPCPASVSRKNATACLFLEAAGIQRGRDILPRRSFSPARFPARPDRPPRARARPLSPPYPPPPIADRRLPLRVLPSPPLQRNGAART
jgi:hypothetical protein